MSSLGDPVAYSYPNARVMALKSFMLRDEDEKALTSAKNLEEYMSLLEHTAYKADISRVTAPSIDLIEDALTANMVSVSRLVTGIAPKGARAFFETCAGIYEAELLKRTINSFDDPSAKRSAEYAPYSSVLSAEMKAYFKSAADAKSKADAVEQLKGTKYSFLSKSSEDELRISGYTDSMIDKHYLEGLWQSISTLSGRDAESARRLVGNEIDVTNIMILLRSAVRGLKAEKFLINGSYKLSDLASQLSGKDLVEITSGLSATSYGPLVSERMKTYEKEASLLNLELAFKRHLTNEYRRAFRGSPFHIGIIYGFLRLKECEIKNLRAIAVSIASGLGQKEITELVIS